MSKYTDKDTVSHLRGEKTTKQVSDDQTKHMSKYTDKDTVSHPRGEKNTKQVYDDKTKDAYDVFQSGKSACVDHDGYRRSVPLCIAAESNNTHIISLLLDTGADVNHVDMFGQTALGYAAAGGHLEAMRVLLDHGADVNAKCKLLKGHLYIYCKSDKTALGYAAAGGHLEAMRVLLDHGADVNAKWSGKTALGHAVAGGYLEDMRVLLDHGADVNPKWSGKTTLGYAVAGGHLEVMRVLLDHGADVNAKWSGKTALGHAVAGGYLEDMRVLLDHGADVNAKWSGKTALGHAVAGGHLEVMRVLLDHGADVNPKGFEKPSLALAAEGGHLEAMRMLIANGADVNQGSYISYTPLIAAVLTNRPEAVALLLASEVDIQTKWHQKTALNIAEERSNTKIVQLLQGKIAAENYLIEKQVTKLSRKQGEISEGDFWEETIATKLKRILQFRDEEGDCWEDKQVTKSMGQLQVRDKAPDTWQIPFQSGLYHIKEKDILISIPEISDPSGPHIYVTTETMHPDSTVASSDNILSDVITFSPHGSRFQKHILIRFPVKSSEAKHIQLMLSDTNYGEEKKWINLKQKNTSFLHQDDMFWFVKHNQCFVFTKHFSCIFMTQFSQRKEQEAIYLSASLHGKLLKSTPYTIEFAVGFHCDQCHPNQLENQNDLGTLLGSELMCVLSEEGSLTAKTTIKQTMWQALLSQRKLALIALMSVCRNHGIFYNKCVFFTEDRNFVESNQTISVIVSVSQNNTSEVEFAVTCDMNKLKQLTTQNAASNTEDIDFRVTSLADSQFDTRPKVIVKAKEGKSNRQNIPPVTTSQTSSSDEEYYEAEVSDDQTNPKRKHETSEKMKHAPSMNEMAEATGYQAPSTVIQNMQQINQYFIAPLPSNLSHLPGLPCQERAGDCVFNLSFSLEQRQLCEFLDNDYNEHLQNIAKEVGDTNGTVDMKNVTGLALLQVWKTHVKTRKCTWRQFYDILVNLKCDKAAQVLKVLFEKDMLLNKLDLLKKQLTMREILGALVSKGVITLEEKDEMRDMPSSKAVEHLVFHMLLKRPYECIQNFHKILHGNRYFKEYVREFMLCREDIDNF